MIALEFLLKYWQYIGMAALLLVVGYFKLSNDKLESKYDMAVAEHKAIVVQFDTLKNSTKECNERVEELSRQRVVLTTKLEEANKSIKDLETHNARIVRNIRNSVVPKDCSGAVDHLVKNIQANVDNQGWGKK